MTHESRHSRREARWMEEVEIGIVASLLVLIGALFFFQMGSGGHATPDEVAHALNVVASRPGS